MIMSKLDFHVWSETQLLRHELKMCKYVVCTLTVMIKSNQW